MNVWIVVIQGRINSVWASDEKARAHLQHLLSVNGDQLPVRIECLEVRE